MAQLRRIIAGILAMAFVFMLFPLGALAEGFRPYESVEYPEDGVVVYHNKDGTTTYEIELNGDAELAPVTMIQSAPEQDRLLDAGACVVGEGTNVRVQIKKEFQEGETLVTVGNGISSVSFYPLVNHGAADGLENESAGQQGAEAAKATAEPTAEPVVSGTITGFVGYDGEKEQKPLDTVTVESGTAREDLPLPQVIQVTLLDVDGKHRLPVKKWTELEGKYGVGQGPWLFQPEWDMDAFPLSEALVSALAGGGEEEAKPDPLVIPYILVKWEDAAEATATPEANITPSPNSTPEAKETPAPSLTPGAGDSEEPGGQKTPEVPQNTATPEVAGEQKGIKTPEAMVANMPTPEALDGATGGQEARGGFSSARLSVRRDAVERELPSVETPAAEATETPKPEITSTPLSRENSPTPAVTPLPAVASPTPVITTSPEAGGLPTPTPEAGGALLGTPEPEGDTQQEGPISVTGRRRGESAILYQDLFEEGTDVKLSALKSGVKEDIIIGEYTGTHSYAYRMNFHGLTPVQNGQEIQLMYMGRQVGRVSAPYMVDAKGRKSTNIAVAFVSLGGGEYELTYTPDDGWLGAGERAYPVTVDPEIEYWDGAPAGSSGSVYATYVNSNAPDSNFGTSGTLYAGGTNTVLGQPVITSAITNYSSRVLILASYVKPSSVSGSAASLNVYPVLGGWGTGTVTANNMPGIGDGLSGTWHSGLAAWNVTPIVASWFNVRNQRANNGIAIGNPGGGTVSMGRGFMLSMTIYRIDEANSLQATAVPNADGTGYVNLSWNAIPNVESYYVGIHNGEKYEYVRVDNATSWSTKDLGLWPTPDEIAAGRYQLHLSGGGAELPASPAATYRNYNSSNNSEAYQFIVLPISWEDQPANPGFTKSAVMPHALKPAQPSSVQVTPSTWTNGTSVTVSWSGIVDYLADGTQLTTLEPGGSIEYSVDGISNWQTTAKNTASGTYTLDIWELADGTHGVYIRGKDKDGNEGPPLGAAFMIDRTGPTAPTVTVIPDTWTNGSSVTLDWTGISEPLSGIARVEYQVDDSGSWTDTGSALAEGTVSLAIGGYAEGAHVVKVRAEDVAGNLGAVGEAAFQKDTVAPTVGGFTTAPASWTDANTVTISWTSLTDAHSGLGSLSYSVDGGAYAALDHSRADGSVGISTAGMLDGTHTVDFRFADQAGNTGAQTVRFYRDTTPPEAVLSQPATGDLVNGIVNVTGTAKDAQAMGSWTLTATGTQTGTVTVGSGTSQVDAGLLGVLDTGAFADGEEITLSLTATDAAGHVTTATGVVVKVDKSMEDVAGGITITAPGDGAVVTSAQVVGAYTGGSTGGHVYIDGVETQTASGRSFDFHAIQYPEGSSHTFTVISEGSGGTLTYSQGLGALVIGSGAPGTDTGTVESGSLSAPKNILALRLSATQSMSSGIAYTYSEDGGATWKPIEPGKDVRLGTSTQTVELKATLNGTSVLHGWELAAIIEKAPVRATVQLNQPVSGFTITHPSALTTGPSETITTDLNMTDITGCVLYADNVLVNDADFAYETLLTPENGSVTLTALALDSGNTIHGSGNAAVLTLKRETVNSAALTVETGALTAAQPMYAIRVLPAVSGSGCKFYASLDNIAWTQINPEEYVFLEEAGTTVYVKAEQRTAGQLSAWHIEGISATGKNFTVQLVNPPTNVVARDYGAHANKRVELSWTAGVGADASTVYVLYKDGVELGFTTGTTYTDSAYTSGATYEVLARKAFSAPDSDPGHIHYLNRESALVAANKVNMAAPAAGGTGGGTGTGNHDLIDFSDEDTLREQYGDTYLFTLDMLTPPEGDLLDNKALGDAPYCSLGFEPVNFNTGNFYLSTRDYGQNELGPGLDILRTYNSRSSVQDGPFGRKWEFPYSQKLELYRDGNIGYRAGDGALTVFKPTGDGYKGNDDEYLNLTVDWQKQEYRVTEKNGTAYVFSKNLGWLLRIEDRQGNATRLERGEDGYLSAIVGQSGARLELSMDKTGHITEITLPDGEKLLYGYQGGNLTSFTDQLGNVTRYVYDRKGQMTQWYDRAGTRQVQNTYDKDGRVIYQVDGQNGEYTLVYERERTVVTDALGQRSEIYFDSLRRTIQEVDARGNTVEYFYDEAGNLTGSTDAYGKLTSSEYDERGNQVKNILPDGSTGMKTYDGQDNLLSFTDGNGSTTAYTYDEKGNLLTATDPTGSVTKYAYNEYGQLMEVTDPTGNTTSYTYAGANVATMTDGLGNVTRYAHDEAGRMALSTDGLGNTRRFDYDGAGRLATLTFADDTSISYTYDAMGNVTSMTGPEGHVTQYEYDVLSRQTAVVYADGTRESVEYDFNGNPVKATDALGNVTTAEYDKGGNRVKVTDALGNVTAYGYDKMNRLVKETLPTGATRTYTYDQQTGLVTETTNETGLTIRLSYDKAGNLLTQTLPNGATTATQYDAAGRVIQKTGALGNKVQYAYDAAGRLTAMTNALGGVSQYAYDGNGNLILATDPLGNETRVEYDPLNRMIAAIDPLGGRTVYAYDCVGNLVSVTDALGNTEGYEYDKNGSLVKLTDGLGQEMSFAYDELGSMTSAVQKNGATVATEYDRAGRVVRETDGLGNATKYEYNELGLVRTITDGLGQTAQVEYDALGNVTKLIGPDGAVTGYAYEPSGRLAEMTDPRGTKTAYEYDEVSNITVVTTHESATKYEYDLAGNVTAMTDAEGRRVEFAYDLAGNLVKTLYPDGTFSSVEYNVLGQVTKQTPRRGLSISYEYDGNGRVISVTEGERTIRYEYDALGNLIKTTYPDGSGYTAEYDALGNPATATDALGSVTGYTYDAMSLLTAVTYANGAQVGLGYDKAGNIVEETDALGAKQTYTYDAVGRMTGVTDALGNRTRYAYDAGDRLTKVTDANGHATTYTYDLGGNLLSETDALGNRMGYSYTPEGWLSTITKADGETISYEYDKTGNVTKETASDGSATSHSYNELGELVTTEGKEGTTKYQYNSKGYLVYVVNPTGEVVSYTYDDYGRKATLTYPDGRKVSYAYDEMDRMTGVTGLDGEQTSYSYDANGRRTKTTSRTLTTEYAYDEVGNLVKQQTTGKTELSLEYVYDRNNAMVSETRVETGSSVKTEYTYDQLGQLTSLIKSSGHREAFVYDSVGNMVGKEFNDAKITMTYDAANELKTMESVKGTIHYAYDANGNLASKTLGNKVDTYAYDTYNQLTSYKGYDGYQQRYTYNAQGHMIRKETKGNENRLTLEELVRGDGEQQAATGDGEEDDPDPDPYAGQASSDSWQSTTYVYDVTRRYYEVLSETTEGVTTAYDYGIERLSAYSGGAWNARKTQYVYDGRGSVVQEVGYNNSWYTLKGRIGKAEVTSYSYSAFGELLQNDSSGFRFNGEAYDSATGMLNLRARKFEPAIGRFEQRDRWAGYATFTLSQNRYTYCVNDPVNLADRGGDRYDEGGVSVASNVSKGMSVAAAVAKSAANQANVQAIYNANVKPTSSKSNGYVSVADLRREEYGDPSYVPKPSNGYVSVADFLQEERAQQRVSNALADLNNAMLGVDKTRLTTQELGLLEEAEQELRAKAYAGTLTEEEKNAIIDRVCGTLAIGNIAGKLWSGYIGIMDALQEQGGIYVQLSPGNKMPFVVLEFLIDMLAEIVPDRETYEQSKQTTNDLAKIAKVLVGTYLVASSAASLLEQIGNSIKGGGMVLLSNGQTVFIGNAVSISKEALVAFAESLGLSSTIVLDGLFGGGGSGGNSSSSTQNTKRELKFESDTKSETKLSNEMDRRGWTKESVQEVVDSPYTTRQSTNLATGNSATAYYRQDGSYVVVDDITNEVVQVSDTFNPNWVPDINIQNPYIP